MTVYVPGLTETDLKKIITAIQQLSAGRSNAVGIVTLTASAASTTVVDQNCAEGSVPILVPTTPHAAAEIANVGTLYIPATTITNGSFVIQHANNSQTDRTYLYALVG